ncbi:alpha-hydroxy acid oxidase [Acidithrix sp. C25]|nr:alpha-hydroxy acid oxidase [Acidithrix sp. C25]
MAPFEPEVYLSKLSSSQRTISGVKDYYFGGAGSQETLRKNIRAFEKITMVPRVLNHLEAPDLSVEVFGKRAPLPIFIAPMAYLSLLELEGEAIFARRAAKSGVSFVLSTRSAMPLEEVASIFHANLPTTQASAPRPLLLLQVYVMKDRAITYSLMNRAVENGFDGFVLTVDSPVIGLRRGDRSNHFEVPLKWQNANFIQELSTSAKVFTPSDFGRGVSGTNYEALVQDPTFSWDDLGEFSSMAGGLPFAMKGVLDPRDVARALTHCDDVILSNHGGRQLDGSITAIQALYRISKGGTKFQGNLIVDGGVDSGADVLRSLGLGGASVMVGRYFARGLFGGGDAGLKAAVNTLIEETKISMALLGAASIDKIDSDAFVVPVDF